MFSENSHGDKNLIIQKRQPYIRLFAIVCSNFENFPNILSLAINCFTFGDKSEANFIRLQNVPKI